MNRRAFLLAPPALTSCAVGVQPEVPAPIDRTMLNAQLMGLQSLLKDAPPWLVEWWAFTIDAMGQEHVVLEENGIARLHDDVKPLIGIVRMAMRDLNRCKPGMTT